MTSSCDFCTMSGDDVLLDSFPVGAGEPTILCDICRKFVSAGSARNGREPSNWQIARDIAVSTRMILRAIKDAS